MSFAELKAKSFDDKDKEKLVKLLNLMHTKVSGLDGKDAVEYVNLMQWAKQTLYAKIDSHVLGEPKIVEAPEDKKPKAKKAKK